MRNYETIYILRPSLNKDELTAVVDKMSAIINRNGGEIRHVDQWGVRRLAYTIKKEYQGYYVHTTYTGEAGTVAELERNLRIDDKVIKYMTVKLKEFREIPLEKSADEAGEREAEDVMAAEA